MIKIELTFSAKDVEALIARAVSSWGAHTEYVGAHCDKTGRAGGYIGIKVKGKSTQITLNHEVIVGAIVDGSAAKGNPIDPASVKFNFIAGAGHGGAQSFSVTATPAAASTSPVKSKVGALSFPFPVELTFSEEETKQLFSAAVAREPGIKSVKYVTLSSSETSVSISVETNGGQSATVKLDEAQLKQTLADELTRKGYTVEADGCWLKYTPGSGYAGGSRTCAHAKLTVLPTS